MIATLVVYAVIALAMGHNLSWLMLAFVWGLYSITYNRIFGAKCVRCYTKINAKEYQEINENDR